MYKLFKFASRKHIESYETIANITASMNFIHEHVKGTEWENDEDVNSIKGFMSQFQSENDQINLRYFDIETKTVKEILVKIVPMLNNNTDYKRYMKTNHHSKYKLTYKEVVEKNIYFMTSVSGLDFRAFDENMNTVYYFVNSSLYTLNYDELDLNKFSHIVSMTDIEDNKVEVVGLLRTEFFKHMKELKANPLMRTK